MGRASGVVLTSVILVALAAEARAVDCAWHADPKPWFPPGQTAIDDQGDNPYYGEDALGVVHMYRREKWKVIVKPGYMYGHAYAWDDITWVITTGSAVVDRSAARDAFYNVVVTSLCAQPVHVTQARGNCTFDTSASTNSPAYAKAAGVTSIVGTLTHLDIKASAGCECGNDQPQTPTKVTFGWTEGQATIQVEVSLEWGEDQQTDAASAADNKTAPVLDEEYILHHELKVRATADSNVFNWTGEAEARLMNHYLWIATSSSCGNCGKSIAVQIIINAASENVQEN